MRPITVIRAVQWAAIVVTGWSLSQPWGDEIAVGKGPPSQWERHVVGAVLLLLLAAFTMTRTARKDSKPGGIALGIAAAASLGAIALALDLRATALDRGQGHVLLGGGWLWMSAGACMAFGSVVSAFTLRFRPAALALQSQSQVSAQSQSKGQSNKPQPKAQSGAKNKNRNKGKGKGKKR